MIFQSARIKLTIWYVAIIMVVSFSFSVFVYQGIMAEVSQGFRLRSGRGVVPTDTPPDWYVVRNNQTGLVQIFPSDDDLFDQIRTRVITQLLIVNGLIFAGSSMAGYFLAGKTLHPIETVMDEQKRFIADASHELRTPLTALKTEIEVSLRDKSLSLSQAKELLRSNLEEVNKMQSLSNYLLAINLYESGEKKLPKKKLQLDEVLLHVNEKFSRAITEKQITVKTEIEPARVYANETSMEELLSILLDNAIKYSHKGGEIRLTIQQGKYHSTITVEDHGVGIKASDIPYIFNRFYRADTSRGKHNVDGYGLGLSIAKSIVEMHKGKIEVQSEVGKGTLFTVTI